MRILYGIYADTIDVELRSLRLQSTTIAHHHSVLRVIRVKHSHTYHLPPLDARRLEQVEAVQVGVPKADRTSSWRMVILAFIILATLADQTTTTGWGPTLAVTSIQPAETQIVPAVHRSESRATGCVVIKEHHNLCSANNQRWTVCKQAQQRRRTPAIIDVEFVYQ